MSGVSISLRTVVVRPDGDDRFESGRDHVKTKMLGGAAVLAVVGIMLATGNGIPGMNTADTSERRKYTLIANTHMGRARVDVRMSSTGGQRVVIENRKVTTEWKTSFWAEANEVMIINFDVRTFGDHRLNTAPWARCEIKLNGSMTGGDAEVDQLPVIKYMDERQTQAEAWCNVRG